MNEYLQKFRAQYPEYGDMSDADLAKALHAKFYQDISFPEFADKIGLGPTTPKEPSVADRLDEHTRSFGLDPNMSAKEFGDMAAGSVQTALGGRLAQQGLGAAVKAIRGVRPVPTVPSPSGLVGPSGSPLMVPGAPAAPAMGRSALDALRAFVRHPVVRGVRSALPWGGLGYLLNERR